MVRLKNRYLLFQLSYEDASKVHSSLTANEIRHAMRSSINTNFGPLGEGLTGQMLTVRYFSPFTNIGIARAARDQYQTVWAATTLITELMDKPCRLVVLHCSGTIRKCQEAAIRYDAEQICVLTRQMEMAGRPVDPLFLSNIQTQNRSHIQQLQS